MPELYIRETRTIDPHYPAVKDTLWNCTGLGLKFVYLISLTKEYTMDPYGNRPISHKSFA